MPHYFQDNFTWPNSVCKENTDLFQMQRQVIVLLLLSVFFSFFVMSWEFFTAATIFLLSWEFFYNRENFLSGMRIFLLLWEFLQLWNFFLSGVRNFLFCENFLHSVRIFFLLWEYFSCCENFFTAVRIICLTWGFFFPKKIFGKPYHAASAQCHAKMTRGSPDYKDSLEKKEHS